MLLFYQGKLIEEYSKKELIEMVKELYKRWDDLLLKYEPSKVALGSLKYKKGGKGDEA